MAEPMTKTAMETGERRRGAYAVALSRWLCVAGATLGAAGLFGWVSHIPALRTLIRGQPTMMPNTGVALTLIGTVGILLGWRRATPILRAICGIAAVVILVIGLGTVAEYLFDVDLGIDQLFITSDVGPYAGRPSPLTALALVLLGFAILIFDSRARAPARPSEWLLIAAILVGLVGATGQILDTGQVRLLAHSPIIGMSVPTAVSLILSSAGMLLARPASGMMAVAMSAGPGGVLLRRIAVPSMIVPLLLALGTTRLLVFMDLEEFPLIVAAVAVAITATGLAILGLTARLLNQTHTELEANRARTREVIALASDGIFMADLDGRYTDVNEAGCRLLGRPPSEIIGKTIFDFLLPEEAERLADSRQQMLEGSIHIGEWHLQHKNGAYIPFEVSARILPGGRWQGLVRDISERKAAEAEAQKAKARIEGIISIAADAIISIDESQRITIFNHRAEQIFGWAAQEAMGRPLDILIPERFREAHRSHIRAFATDPMTSRRMGRGTLEIYGLRKDGTEFLGESAISKLRIDDELTFTVVFRDVTSVRRRAEQDRLLAEVGLLMTSSLERKQVVQEAAQLLVREFADACVIDLVDPEADENVTRLAVVHRDPQMQEIAKTLEHIVLDPSRPHLSSESLRTRKTKLVKHVTPASIEATTQSPEHRKLVEQVAAKSLITAPLLARGHLLGAITFVSRDEARRYDEADVTFVEEIARRLALAIDNARLFEALQTSITARGEVMRIVAHDLRNPLGTILMGVQVLQEPGDGNGLRRKSVTTIESAAKRMNRLIRDLLDVGRSEAGRLTIEHAPASADTIVRDAAASQQPLANKASLQLRTECPNDLPKVYGDRDRLLQVFENLIGNAIKFTPAGGAIAVGAASRGHEVLFSVSDTGEGMAAEELPRVWDPFWRGHHKGKGAGLGLMIVKALVEAHEGRVWVESAPGRGSTFYFTIPVAHEPVG